MHNKGPAPLGNLPVSVHIDPATLRVTVATDTVAARGRVELDHPAGPFDYDLAPGEHRDFDLRITGREPGRHFLTARILDPYGQLLEDVAVLEPPPDLEVSLGPAEVLVPPGGTAALTLRLHNPAVDPVHGEVQLLSPYGTWADEVAVDPWIQGYRLEPGSTETLRFTVRAAPEARPGSRWWALARVVGMGRVAYTASVSLAVTQMNSASPPTGR
ncbi:COG1470 family protein [Paractinoplanes durhamensis]